MKLPLRTGASIELAGEIFVDLANAGGMRKGSRIVHAVGHGKVFTVVGDGDVTAAAGNGGFCHFTNGAGAVGLGGVHMHVAVQVGEGDELRESVVCCSFELTAVFTQLRGNVVETKRVVDFGFRSHWR